MNNMYYTLCLEAHKHTIDINSIIGYENEFSENVSDTFMSKIMDVQNSKSMKDSLKTLRALKRNKITDFNVEILQALECIEGYFTLLIENNHINLEEINIDKGKTIEIRDKIRTTKNRYYSHNPEVKKQVDKKVGYEI